MSGSEEKDLPASDKKLKEARGKGQVSKSVELITACVTLGGFSYVLSQLTNVADKFTGLIMAAGDAADQPIWTVVRPLGSRVLVTSAGLVAPFLLVVLLTSIVACVISMGGPILTFQPLMPKFSSLNPVTGFGKLFSVRKLIDLVKNLLKVGAVVSLSVIIIEHSLAPLVQQPSCGLACVPAVLKATLTPLFIMGSIFFVVIGIADIGIQKWLFLRDQKMTRTEMKQETKNSDGDPVVKAAYRRARRDAEKMRAGLKQSTFCITGPKVFVALRYSAIDTKVPAMMARAEDARAGEMLIEAREFRKPVHHDAELARLLHDGTRLGHPISKDLFQSVIAVMRGLGIV